MFCYHPTFKFIQIHKKLSDAIEEGSELYRLKTEDNIEIRKIFAKCLDRNMTLYEISYIFSVFGEVENVELKFSKKPSHGKRFKREIEKNYCFITFCESVTATRVLFNRKQLSEYFEIEPADSWNQPDYKDPKKHHQNSSQLQLHTFKESSLMRLHDYCFFQIFKYLDAHDMIALKNVCKRFSDLVLIQLKTTKCLDFEKIKVNSKMTLMEFRNILMDVGCHLEELHINSSKFNSNNNNRILDLVPKCKNLKILHMNGFKLGKATKYFKKIVQRVEHLNMSDSSEMSDDFLTATRKNKKLKILNLSNNNLLNGKCLLNFENLQSLNISNCRNVNGKHLKEFCKINQLRELDISNCDNLNGNEVNEILLNYGNNMESLHLNNIYADSNSVIYPNISKLDNLRKLKICNVHYPPEDQALSTLNPIDNKIQELHIPYGNMSLATLNFLTQMKNLKILNLNYKRSTLSDNDEKLLYCVFENNSDLEELHLADTTFADASTSVLNAVWLLDKLKVLNISKCFGINNEIVKKIIIHLLDKKNPQKLNINLGMTDVDVNILKEPLYRENKNLVFLNWKVSNCELEHDYDIDETQTGFKFLESQSHESFNLDDVINLMSSIEDCDHQLIALIKQKLVLDKMD